MKVVKLFLIPLIVVSCFLVLVVAQIVWATNTDLTQEITAGTLSVDIVDADGVSVASPSVAFESKAFSFDAQNATATLGVASEKIRLSNPTATATWSVSMAATDGVSAVWDTGTLDYPYNAASADDGRLSVNFTGGNIAGVDGCSTNNVSLGSPAFYLAGTTNSIDLMSASAGAAIGCRWDLTGVGLEQRIPASQAPGNYSINMTITAN
jgi:hypothetical protein